MLIGVYNPMLCRCCAARIGDFRYWQYDCEVQADWYTQVKKSQKKNKKKDGNFYIIWDHFSRLFSSSKPPPTRAV